MTEIKKPLIFITVVFTAAFIFFMLQPTNNYDQTPPEPAMCPYLENAYANNPQNMSEFELNALEDCP